ncbi:MAG: hypothetical protein JXR78_15295 [Victivallales bacterium]|nr:hypothetical protein [Victivallales bacterium]
MEAYMQKEGARRRWLVYDRKTKRAMMQPCGRKSIARDMCAKLNNYVGSSRYNVGTLWMDGKLEVKRYPRKLEWEFLKK